MPVGVCISAFDAEGHSTGVSSRQWLRRLDQVSSHNAFTTSRGITLRPRSSGQTELRILFAFDPDRQTILLIAGDKSRNWTRWYTKNAPMADNLLDAHLRTLKGK